jgi:uncharacterized spore protein YtfJ
MRFKKLSWLTLIAFLFSVITPLASVTPVMAADTAIDNAVAEIAAVYQYLDENDKAAIRTARDNLLNLTETEWIEPLLTDQVKGKFGSEDTAREEILNFATALGNIYYSSDSATLTDTLTRFKEDYKDSFQLLFGTSITIADLYNFLVASKQELPVVLKTTKASLVPLLAHGTNEELIKAMPDLTIAAMHKVLNIDQYNEFSGKLSALGWSAEKLVDQQRALATIVDPGNAAELALAKAAVRSQAKAYSVNGTQLTLIGSAGITLPKPQAESFCKIRIMDKEATSLVAWASSNESVVEVDDANDNGNTLKLTARKAGQSIITAYRDYTGATAANDWILRFTVNVNSLETETKILTPTDDGTVQISSGTPGITLGNDANLQFNNVPQADDDGQITVGGASQNLTSFTSGSLNQVNLTQSRTIGDQPVTIKKAVKLESGIDGESITIMNEALPTAELQIPDATTILAPDSWDGKILPPKAGQSNPADSAPSGFRIGGTVIEVGAPNAVLLFDQPVTIFLKGVTGNMAYRPADSSQWVKINQAGGTYDNPTPPPAFGEAYISNGVDTKIITWHLTAFAVLTPISSGGGVGGGGSTFTGTTVTTSGGTVTGSGAAIEIPANAMNSSFKVKIEKVSNTSSLPMAENLVSDVLEITKDKSGNFDKPVTITVPYDKNKVDLSKQKISLYWLDGQIWRELDNIQIDEVNGKISGEVNHFTKFAVLATDIDKAAFTDIAGHWAAANIEALVNAGVITGYPDGTFKPNNTITRAEFATAVVKAFNLELKSGKVFNDTANHWAEDFIATAAANGLISGYNDTTFGPNDLITREQMAVLIVNATGLTEVSSAKTFADGASISDWAKDGVAIASGNDLITGYPDNTFKPKGNATRAEAVTILINALTLE